MSDPRSPEQIEADVVAQREQLAQTVEELSAKLDVKSQAQAKVSDLKDAATTPTGSPRPELLALAGALLVVAVAVTVWRRRTH